MPEFLSPESEPSLLLLIDHDNVPYDRVSLRDLLFLWIDTISGRLGAGLKHIQVRAYGGWFNAEVATESRFRAAEFYQRHCPAVFSRDHRFYRVNFEFADYIIGARRSLTGHPDPRITHTVAVRSSSQWVLEKTSARACEATGCELKQVRRWIKKKRACMRAGCGRAFKDHFERREQKQVDVHLATDLLLAQINAPSHMHVAVVSGDWDLLPAIAAIAAQCPFASTTLVRTRKEPTYLDGHLAGAGVEIVQL